MTHDTPLGPTDAKGEIRARMWQEALAVDEAGRPRDTEACASDYLSPSATQANSLGARCANATLAGKTAMVFGDPDQPHSWNYIDDVVTTLVTLGHDELAWGSGWLVPTNEPFTIRELLRQMNRSSGEWPLQRYFTPKGVPVEVSERYPWSRASRPTSMRKNIEGMPEDDDLNYAMLNLHVLEAQGVDFTTADVATAWLQMMPVLTVFTAERVAYENLLNCLLPPQTALHRNPYREWIGAQIRADVWGWVSPGDPGRAAELAWRAAWLSHSANGIYGEMFVAAIVASAFTTEDVVEVVETRLRFVPEGSRLTEAIRFISELSQRTNDWEEALDLLCAQYGHYHWVHTINNAALVSAALLYGTGDFESTICKAVMGGWDTDCNGATVDSIVGVMRGPTAIPESWSGPLDNRIRTGLKGFDNSWFDDLAARTRAQVPEGYKS